MEEEIPAYSYNNLHSPDTIQELNKLIDNPDNRFMTAAGLKRSLSTRVLKKFIQ